MILKEFVEKTIKELLNNNILYFNESMGGYSLGWKGFKRIEDVCVGSDVLAEMALEHQPVLEDIDIDMDECELSQRIMTIVKSLDYVKDCDECCIEYFSWSKDAVKRF